MGIGWIKQKAFSHKESES